MGESEGREDEIGDTDAGPVPEGFGSPDGPAGGAARRDRLSSLRGRTQPTGDMSLDLAAALDEPEQLVRHLIIAAQDHVGYSENEAKWKVVLGHAASAAKELEKLNEPASHRGAKASSF
jgi:hypothetical protein